MMEQLIYWVKEDSSGLGRPQLPGDVPSNSMAVPMMLLCLVQQLTDGRGQEVVHKYGELASWCVQLILQHIQVRTQILTDARAAPFPFFAGASAFSSPRGGKGHVALWYTGVKCRLHRMYTHISSALWVFYSGLYSE